MYVGFLCFIFCIIKETDCLFCYNGTFRYNVYGEDPLQRRTLFSYRKVLSRRRCASTIKCRDETMCFVRSWTARARHAWIVQRGCYQIQKGDLLPRTMNIPMRSMSCKNERFPEADYKVCFCQADWCNLGTSIYKFSNTFGAVIFIFFCTYNLLKLYFYNLPVTNL